MTQEINKLLDKIWQYRIHHEGDVDELLEEIEKTLIKIRNLGGASLKFAQELKEVIARYD